MNLTRITSKAVNLAFSLASQLLRPVVFYKVTGYSVDSSTGVQTTNLSSAAVNALVVSYQSRDVDGVSILAGDEKWLVKNSELSDIDPIPAANDWFEDVGIRAEIISAVRDASGQLWTFQVRKRAFDPTADDDNDIDLGTVTAEHDSSEDMGDLSKYDSSEDLYRDY